MKYEKALAQGTPGEWVFAESPTQIGKCYQVGAQQIVDGGHGGACLYDDSTSLNPHKEGEQKANAALIVHEHKYFKRLLEYANHKEDCQITLHLRLGGAENVACTCGYNAMIKEASEVEGL